MLNVSTTGAFSNVRLHWLRRAACGDGRGDAAGWMDESPFLDSTGSCTGWRDALSRPWGGDRAKDVPANPANEMPAFESVLVAGPSIVYWFHYSSNRTKRSCLQPFSAWRRSL